MQSLSHLVRIDLVEGTVRGEVEQVEGLRQQNGEQMIRETRHVRTRKKSKL